MHFHRYGGAVIALILALTAALLAASPSVAASDCPSGLTQFKIDNRPSNGTYGDGTLSVTISDADEDSFDWSSNIEVESVFVKGGPVLEENPGGTSGTARSPENPSNDQRYGISHVSFCYTTEDDDDTDRDDNGDDKECPENAGGNGKGRGKGLEECEEVDEDDEDEDDADDDSDLEDDSDTDDDVRGGVDRRPSRPAVDEEETGPETRVRGLRVRGGTGPDVAAAPEVRAEHRRDETEAETLPRTGLTVLPWLLLSLGLIASGGLLWRRRRSA